MSRRRSTATVAATASAAATAMAPLKSLKSLKSPKSVDAESLWALPLVEALPVGIASVDLSGFILRCNDAFARIAGSDDADALRGRPLAGLFVRADRDDLTRQLSKLVMRTAKCVRLDGLGADRSGLPSIVNGTGPLALIAFPLVERGDVNSIGVCVVAEIERVVDGAALAQRQKMQAVGQLAGGIAHDFNNLLTAMLGFCDLLLTRHQAGDPSHDEIHQVRDNAIRAAGLVRQLLAFSRKQTLSPVRLSVEPALAKLSAMLPRLLGPAIEFRLNVAADVGDIEVDPNQFDQIIVNLAVNAKDAMPSGGTLTIRTRQSRRSDHVDCAGEVIPTADYVCIDVSDTGVGIPKEIIGHIFEPFFTTKDVGAGTGLGLATVFGIVRQMGGFILVDSALGEGTTFTVMLPVCAVGKVDGASDPAAVAKADEALAVRSLAAGKTPTVLIVDDEDPIRVFAARALRKAGLRVLEAVSGEQALEVIATRSEPIDVLLTDVIMPGMDGYTLAQIVRRDHADLRVIAMSGFQEDAILAGHNDEVEVSFLAKPFTLAELNGKVHALLQPAGQF